MDLREFWQCVDTVFGVGHGRTIASEHVVLDLGGSTPQDALGRGIDPGAVWRAMCADFDVPYEYHWGLPEARR
ncbi:DUF3046 domain-containing protein [Rarobacter faecitabidus]|uniref:DUF3046 family protein n=1 Tax=Rarobacter faecitabidus TaxID=13243 RepID=A0A542ZWB9_RARFA|nr:DUF3046 domain-containing protein [Rarobacter faecitabidus]TQL64647.1 DUF3046 family protein [Rarobacter faecitabidus]